MLTKLEKIIRLKRAILSPETPDYVKAQMEEELAELEKPDEPAPIISQNTHKKRPYVRKKPLKAKEPIKTLGLPKIEEKAPPIRVLTQEEKEAKKAEYDARRAKRKEKENQE